MPQWIYVLRGCVVAYLAGVIVFTIIATLDGPASAGESFALSLIFGGLLAIPFAIVALLIWAVLARMRKRVSVLQAAAICAGVFFCVGGVLGFADGGILTLLSALVITPLLGGLFGSVFWFGAFGRQREVQLAFRGPAP